MAMYAASFFFFVVFSLHSSKTAEGWVQSGYWYSGSEIPISDINTALFTHLICSFAYINSTSFELSINSSNIGSFTNFTAIVRRRNPRIITLLSIWGGGENPAALAAMVGESSSRNSFIKSSIETARAYGFSGLDLLGFKPSYNNSTTMKNISILLKEWRTGIESEAKLSGKMELFLTMGAYAQQSRNYPLDSMKSYLDWVHIVAYDYHLPTRERFIYPHAPLFGPSNETNTDFCIDVFVNGGFTASNLVLGLPFHGYAWKLENVGEDSVSSPSSGPAFTLDGSMGYKSVKSYVQNNGYGTEAVYNSTYVVNIFVKGTTWINFDGPEVITRKVSYAKEKGLLGYNIFQISNDMDWELSRAAYQASQSHKHKRWLLWSTLTSVPFVILLLCSVTYYLQRRGCQSQELLAAFERFCCKLLDCFKVSEIFHGDTHNLQAFSFAKLKAATSNFSSENKLGEGGFGIVYKGKLSNGQQIAVKRLSRYSNQGLEEFKNEVMLTGRLQHVNLVRLVGFCTNREEKMLVYEYMPRKSLNFYLFDPVRRNEIDWDKRINIIQGITQGLLYLQKYSNFTIIHRDLKASNILLDVDMTPKISDFGMARIFQRNETEANTGRIVGTYGYVPPEYVRSGIYSMKYDIYSFGVVLLQIISGKRTTCFYGTNTNLNLLQYAYEMWRDGYGMDFIDPCLEDSSSPVKLLRCMQVALLCVQEDPQDRPSIVEISAMLNNQTMEVNSPGEPAFSNNKCKERKCTEKDVVYSMNDQTVSDVDPR